MSFLKEGVIYRNSGGEIAGLTKAPPDPYVPVPYDELVLCRDGDGKATAIYGGKSWDFNPYRLSSRRINVMQFDGAFECHDEDFKEKLIGEIKFLLYKFMYFSSGGRIGRTSASTLAQYNYSLVGMAKYCVHMRDNQFARGITIIDVLSNPAYLNSYLVSDRSTNNQHKNIKSLLGVLSAMDSNVLGFAPCSREGFKFERMQHEQHPVIPSRIYIHILRRFGQTLEPLFERRREIEDFIVLFSSRLYGLTEKTQKSMLYGNKHPNEMRRPVMEEAITLAGLNDLLSGPFSVTSRHSLVGALQNIQYLVKMTLHLYTGMRDQETARLKYDCLGDAKISEPTVSENGAEKDSARIISLISTTTKFTGHKKKTSWLAPEEVTKAVAVAQSICRGVCALHGIDHATAPLFINPGIIRSENTLVRTSSFTNAGDRGGWTALATSDFNITGADLSELQMTDPDRDFYGDKRFSMGAQWPLTSHQFRRSLAYYASNSGFVSMPTITTQFKHLSRLMSQYYTRNSGNMKRIFGDPRSHVGYDFQVAQPIEAVQQLFSDVFGSEDTILGGTGSYLEKQKAKVASGEISIEEAKETTFKRAVKGELQYHPTPLGGCSKLGPCDDFLKGDYTACLTCHEALIQPSKVGKAIDASKAELSGYEENSAEWELVKFELDSLERYRAKKIDGKRGRNYA